MLPVLNLFIPVQSFQECSTVNTCVTAVFSILCSVHSFALMIIDRRFFSTVAFKSKEKCLQIVGIYKNLPHYDITAVGKKRNVHKSLVGNR